MTIVLGVYIYFNASRMPQSLVSVENLLCIKYFTNDSPFPKTKSLLKQKNLGLLNS